MPDDNLFGAELETTGNEWDPLDALAAVIWIAALVMLCTLPAVVIAVWRWAL